MSEIGIIEWNYFRGLPMDIETYRQDKRFLSMPSCSDDLSSKHQPVCLTFLHFYAGGSGFKAVQFKGWIFKEM